MLSPISQDGTQGSREKKDTKDILARLRNIEHNGRELGLQRIYKAGGRHHHAHEAFKDHGGIPLAQGFPLDKIKVGRPDMGADRSD